MPILCMVYIIYVCYIYDIGICEYVSQNMQYNNVWFIHAFALPVLYPPNLPGPRTPNTTEKYPAIRPGWNKVEKLPNSRADMGFLQNGSLVSQARLFGA